MQVYLDILLWLACYVSFGITLMIIKYKYSWKISNNNFILLYTLFWIGLVFVLACGKYEKKFAINYRTPMSMHVEDVK